MSDLPDTALFPLPLVAFEQYMFTDDRPDYPANFFLRLSFAGIFDRPTLHAAADTALRRHPLLRALVRASGEKRFEWVAAEHPGPLITWKADAGLCTSAAGPRIDLRHETGLRIFISQRENQTEMLLQFHHACCDGFGAVRFLEDLLAAYHNAIGEDSQKVSLPPLDIGRLRVRGKFGMNPLKYVLRAHKEFAGALGLVEYLALRPVPLAPQGSGSSGEIAGSEFPASSVHTFSVPETEKLRRATKQIGCTVNDLLLRDLFLALHEWMSQQDPHNKAGWLRIMIPVNLRSPVSSPGRLMSILRMEMKVCKRWRLGLSMVHVLGLARRFRGGLQRLLPADRCVATSVLSNLGDLADETVLPRRDGRIVAANMTLERVELLPPLRPMTQASFGAVSYAGRLTVSLVYDPHHFSRQDGRQLLGGFVRRIQSSLNEAE